MKELMTSGIICNPYDRSVVFMPGKPTEWKWWSEASNLSIRTRATSKNISCSAANRKDFQSVVITGQREVQANEILDIICTVENPQYVGDLLEGCEGILTQPVVCHVLKCLDDKDVALEFFKWAERQHGYRHFLKAYNCLLDLLVKSGSQSIACSMFERMKQVGCAPSSFTFGILICGFSKAGDIEQAFGLFEEMRKEGLRPNVKVDEATTTKWNSCHPDICMNFRELYCSKENSKCSSRAKNGSKKQQVPEKFVTSREIFATDVSPEHEFEVLTTCAINDFAKEDEEAYEEDESDDDGTFQQPAFAVDGEPDFDSGPPQDGWEYLRRVRWEAAQCPRVKVAKIAPEKLLAEQTSYMPKIPSIPSCAPEVLPSKEWENMFLADFSGLRLFLSKFPRSAPIKHFPHFRDQMAWQAFCFGKSNTDASCEDKGDISNDEMEEHSMQSDEDMETNSEVQDLTPVEDTVEAGLLTADQTGESLPTADQTGENNILQIQETAHQPLMSIILALDEVSRAALLRYHIAWFEDIKSLSEDRVLWIFALAAVVDKPLDPETCAAFRTLLRKCAVMRASKEQRSDKELYMLNILITISGRYFGQDDSLN